MTDKNQPFYLPPGQVIPKEITEELKTINDTYSKSKDFPKYLQDIRKFFNLNQTIHSTDSRLFFAGFLEGEGSLNVSAKKLETAKFGLIVDPEFNLTQHINGVNHLYSALAIFQTGRIRYKSGSNATLVFTIDNRIALEEKVIPFYEKYVAPYAAPIKYKRVQTFKQILLLFKQDAHKDLDQFTNKLLPLWDSLRMQKGQSNESFSGLLEAQDFARNRTSFISSFPLSSPFPQRGKEGEEKGPEMKEVRKITKNKNINNNNKK
jgi:hypothetical protein